MQPRGDVVPELVRHQDGEEGPRELRRVGEGDANLDDRFVPAGYVEEFASLIPGAGMAIISDAAHMVPYEQPADVFRTLDGWITAGAFSDEAEAASGQKMRQKVKG